MVGLDDPQLTADLCQVGRTIEWSPSPNDEIHNEEIVLAPTYERK
jgi:hypothetical protein